MGPHNLSGCLEGWKEIKIDSSETFKNFKHWNSQVCQHCVTSIYDVNLTILILLLQFEVWRKYRFLLNSNFQHKITANFVTLKLYFPKRRKKKDKSFGFLKTWLRHVHLDFRFVANFSPNSQNMLLFTREKPNYNTICDLPE